MDNIFEKISLTLTLLKIFDIYFFCYLATNEKIAITHLWHAIDLTFTSFVQTMYHLIAKDKVAEQHIVVIGVFNQIKYNVNFIQFKFHNILIIPILTYNSTSIG